MSKIGRRWVHLDFHTSELMPDVGSEWSKENFQEALKIGHLDSITIFAKCHHSWAYYPSKAGAIHPTLKFDMLGGMINAAHEIGVRCPVYITVGWSANDAEKYPNCVARMKSGEMKMSNGKLDADPNEVRPIVSWKLMCPSGEYVQLIYDQTKEICDRYSDLDGLFYDICFGSVPCFCPNCIKGMMDEKIDLNDEVATKAYGVKKWQGFMSNCTALLREKHKDGTIFFNGGAEIYGAQYHAWQTQYEMEDLPTTWGGYDKMPIRAKYMGRYNKPVFGMTGKFHTMWGEFGGFKNPDALKYECATIETYGAGCCVGDQMHPCGKMDLDTYRLIGKAYEYAKKIEPFCEDSKETSRLGMILSGNSLNDEGLTRMLLERHFDFQVVILSDDLSKFDCLILPDNTRLDNESAAKLKDFIKNGGSVLLSGQSGLDKDGKEFMIDIGLEFVGKSVLDVDYMVLGEKLKEGLLESPFVCYKAAYITKPVDCEVLAGIKEPYFKRTYGHYSSHQNTPNRLDMSPQPSIVKKGNIVYMAHEIFKLYYDHGAQIHRDIFVKALSLIYTKPVCEVKMPSGGRMRFSNQTLKNRYVLNLTYAVPIKRGRCEVVEDLIPIYNLPVIIRINEKIKRVYMALTNKELSFIQQNGELKVVVPEVECHQAVVFEY
ncbi:MAG: alpha-amylase family protein [Eubacteriales bacterium]